MSREIVVTAGIIRRNDAVLIALRPTEDKLAGFWEFPGGKVEKGETPEECLIRELQEELGILVRVGKKLSEGWHEYDHGNFCVLAYLVEGIADEPRPFVHDRIEWVKIDDLNEYNLLPADIPIVTSLQKLKKLECGELH